MLYYNQLINIREKWICKFIGTKLFDNKVDTFYFK